MSIRALLIAGLMTILIGGCASTPEMAPSPETHNVLFDTNKSDLRPESVAYLNGLAEFLKANPSYDVVLEGHTDNSASNEYNLALAERRAKAVQAHLRERGVSISRSMVVSYGESRPVAPNQTQDGMQENRRVSVTAIAREPVRSVSIVHAGVPKNEYNGTDPAIPGRESSTLRATHR